MPRSLGAMHLSNSKSFEIQRTNHFEVQIQGFGEEITLLVESFPLPKISNSPIELSYGNSKVKVAGQASLEDGELVIKDAIGVDTEKKIYDWHRQVYNPETDRIGWAADYKRQVTVFQYAPDGTFIRTWKVLGAWPSNVNYGDMTNEGGDKKTVSVTLSFDKAYPVR